MSIRQRKGVWYVDFYAPSGERIRHSAGTADKKAAQEYHDRLKAQLWRQHRLGEQKHRSYSEAALRYLETCAGQSDYDSKVRYVAYWRQHIGHLMIHEITADAIFDGLPTHKVYKHKGKEPLTPATKNRYLATIRHMLNLCVSWGWIHHAPKIPNFQEPKKRIRWVTQTEAMRLIECIPQQWLRDACILGFATGMREAEIYGLGWGQINEQACTAWVGDDQTKSGRARSIPLNADAMGVIKRRRGSHPRFVLSRNGKQIVGGDDRMFKQALAVAGIEDFRFHDVRHTWASWHVQAGTPLMVLKELGGWETIEMVQKYAHLAPSHLAAHANTVTFWAQGQETAKENGNEDCALVAVNC